MRLEKIALNGFKSFADKTAFTFDYPITAIVGPNGCGKSNIVDAVKWVLGEQSVKSLRSGQMADVIFSGSSSRKPSAAAEVSLFISNTMGQLPLETDQVQISRRIYKSGESEYRINNKICRLKDIRELFMDTGIGVRAYSIIEQGHIEQLLNSSKTDRRVIFEEAAGISKYKAHKKEALRKLERTDQNLLRLADILGEVQKQLRSIKYQAGKARNYLQYTQRLKELQVNYSLVEYHKIKTETDRKKSALDQIQQKYAAIAAEVAREDASISELGHQIIETENQINQADNSLVTVQGKIEQHFQRIEFSKEKIEELSRRKTTAQNRIGKLTEQQTLFHTDRRQCKIDLARSENTLLEKSTVIEQLETEIHRVNSQCTSLEAELEDEKSGIIDIVRRTAQLHNEVQSITVYRNNLASQKQRLSGRAETAKAELEKLLTEKAQQKARLEDIEKVLTELQQNLRTKQKATEQINNKIAENNKRLAHSKETRSALSSELAVLKDMETRREGLNSAIKNILRKPSSKNYIDGLLADIIDADVKYANAVEAALAGNVEAIVVNDTSELLSDTVMLEKLDGRVNFICTDRIEPFVDNQDLSNLPGVLGRVVEFVKAEGKYASLIWKLLGKTIVVDSIETAVELSRKIPHGYKFVTPKGEFFGLDGLVKLGPLGRSTGLISRKSRLKQLEKTIEDTIAEIANVQQQIERDSQQSQHLAKLCQDLRTAIYEAETEKVDVNSKLAICEQNVKRLKDEQPLIAGEIDQLEEQIAQSVQKQYDSQQKLQELETVNSQRTNRIEKLESEFAEKKQLQLSLTTRLTDLRVEFGQITEQTKALKQTIESLGNQSRENTALIETAQQEIETCAEQATQSQREILRCETEISELFVEKEKAQENSSLLHSEIEQMLQQQREKEQTIRQKRTEKDRIEQQINELKVELGQLEIKSQNLIERVRDELQLDLEQSYEDYRAEKGVDWDEVKDEITELRGKIERLGNVNLDAIDQQQALEERNEFLSSQVGDLNKSKIQLQQLINRLNKQSRERFAQTFEQISRHFQQIFRKLFGGGKADIILEDCDDILEAGIEIIAQPPGKETRSISLLSGGEKTMTAIALLFAVFKTKPSPFCLLDEVDAALDEANNERFNMIIREFQKDSQFIIITHAKRTMSIADVLYGITMQTRGVSKKISVRFGDIEADQEVTAVA